MVPWWPIQLLALLLFQENVIVPWLDYIKRTIISACVTTKRTTQTEPSLFLKFFCLNWKGRLSHFVVQRRGFQLLASFLFQENVIVLWHCLHNTHNYISLGNIKTDRTKETSLFLKFFCLNWKGRLSHFVVQRRGFQLLASFLFQENVIVLWHCLHNTHNYISLGNIKTDRTKETSLFLKFFCLNKKGWLSHFVVQRRGFHLLASLLFKAKVIVPRHSLHNTHNYISLGNNKTDRTNRNLPFLKIFLVYIIEYNRGMRMVRNRRPPPREKLKSSNRGA